MLYALLACTPTPMPTPGTPPSTTGEVTVPDTDTEVDTDTVDTDATGPTGDTAPPIDCSVLPPVPAAFDTYFDWGRAEDFDLDGQGYHVAVPFRDLRGRLPNGDTRIISPQISDYPAGTRVLPNGNILVADVTEGTIVQVDAATGAQSNVMTGLAYPNGLEVSADGVYAFVGEQNANRVRQIEIATGNQWEVAAGLTAANGVILSPDEQILFVGSFGAGKVWGVPRVSDTEWGASFVVFDQPGLFNGGFDGINVDACSNVYVTEYIRGTVWRIPRDGSTIDKLVELPSSWIPNMRWGHGIGGWEPDILYVADRDQGRIFAVHAGILGKKHVLAP